MLCPEEDPGMQHDNPGCLCAHAMVNFDLAMACNQSMVRPLVTWQALAAGISYGPCRTTAPLLDCPESQHLDAVGKTSVVSHFLARPATFRRRDLHGQSLGKQVMPIMLSLRPEMN